MTNLEIAEFLGTRCSTTDQAIAFLEGDCGISGLTKQTPPNLSGVDFVTSISGPTPYFYQGKQIYEEDFGYGKEFIQNLMPLLTAEEQARVREVVRGMAERSKPAKASGGKAPAVVNNITNNNSAQANAQNTIGIKTLIGLSAYVSNSSTITNKAEIQNTLSALEDAKDGDSAESYIGLLIKLVGLLCKDGILPPFVGKLVGGLGKWFK